MASLIPGYEYDVFISYRQKDNKHDGWVTEFVENLKAELESLVKEDISLYFDINAHNGLLETYDVDESLRAKLRCAIFIPVISRTYCDTRAYAWEHELLPFLELASNDSFGLKVRLANGNVASRVLPVRIHELDFLDIKVCEKFLGGELRSVDFIYKSAGVNRPLRAREDHPHDNMNRTYYLDQINKTANAITEILLAMRGLPDLSGGPAPGLGEKEAGHKSDFVDIADSYKSAGFDQTSEVSSADLHKPLIVLDRARHFLFSGNRKIIVSAFLVLLIASLVMDWKGLLKNAGLRDSKADIITLHIQNANKYCEDGFLDEAKTEAELVLSIDPENSAAWTTMAAISARQGELNKALLQTLEALKFDPSNGHAAYNLAFALEEKKDFDEAVKWYINAISADSALVPAYSALGRLYNNMNQPTAAILILTKAKEKYPDSEYNYLIYKNLGNSYLLLDIPGEAIRFLELSLGLKGDESETNLFLSRAYEAEGHFDKSIDFLKNYLALEKDTSGINEGKKHLDELINKSGTRLDLQ